jgi:hypothetical protein
MKLGGWCTFVINKAAVYNHLNDVQFQSCSSKLVIHALLICDDNVLEISIKSENYHYDKML